MRHAIPRAWAPLAVVGTLLGLAGLAGTRASAAEIVYFQTPSKNIGCAYIPALSSGDVPYLRCEITSGLRPKPPRPAGCGDAVWGRAVWMTRRGRAQRICISDTIREPSAPVLGYGRTWRAGRFTCVSKRAGLRCTNLAAHGWFLSRKRSTLF
jgi:hypothetical protein